MSGTGLDSTPPLGTTATSSARAAHRQGIIGLSLAALIVAAWTAVHVTSLFGFRWSSDPALLGLGMMALQTWLYVGLFIVAHDCMHGSLMPFRPGVNRAVGQLCLALYAGFSFDALNRKHHRHHRFAGTHDDPDFLDAEPHAFWPWYVKFFSEYFSWRQVAIIAVWVWAYVLLFEVPLVNIVTFWAVPALLSSLQLFTFGTYLPHRPDVPPPFTDRHRSRSNDYPWLVSLLTCFHFGYHHEHHDVPDAPWWRLPSVHARAREEHAAARPAG